jgi:hypothetical protein
MEQTETVHILCVAASSAACQQRQALCCPLGLKAHYSSSWRPPRASPYLPRAADWLLQVVPSQTQGIMGPRTCCMQHGYNCAQQCADPHPLPCTPTGVACCRLPQACCCYVTASWMWLHCTVLGTGVAALVACALPCSSRSMAGSQLSRCMQQHMQMGKPFNRQE